MLRQVTLALDAQTMVQEIAASHRGRVDVLDCKDLNDKEMEFLLEVSVPGANSADLIGDLEGKGIFKKIYAGRTDQGPSRSICVGIIDRPAICQSVSDCGVFCLSCPYSSSQRDGRWNVLVKDSDQLKDLLAHLEANEVEASIAGLSDVGNEDELTERQTEVLRKAIYLGYFEFPRRLSLTQLSEHLGIKPSTLSQILRAAEGKVIARYAAEMKITKTLPLERQPDF